MFPTLTQVIQISLTIPVSSCTCERTFSVLRRLHTWLRSTMGQDRLHHLAIMSVEREELSKFSHSQDMVNHKISIDMMLKIGNSQHFRQFIILTPQSMSSLPESKFIRILQMKDPERGSHDQASSRDHEDQA
ncbi:Structural maintenance of chromosomes protein 6 [Merluccius polli]|uniref:Structural maintenance of chromosomes protein 6 n=1 Tax=Merluccius polli TaxID=89951 RepID=A0AA47MJ94_MERPO|nr:Structural maintenance of chromosomes protein 6 [Merluccius polli]